MAKLRVGGATGFTDMNSFNCPQCEAWSLRLSDKPCPLHATSSQACMLHGYIIGVERADGKLEMHTVYIDSASEGSFTVLELKPGEKVVGIAPAPPKPAPK